MLNISSTLAGVRRRTGPTSKRSNSEPALEAVCTIGLDLSDKDAEFWPIERSRHSLGLRKSPTYANRLRKAFGVLVPARIALETCGQSAWVKDVLEELGHEVVVANASELRSGGQGRGRDGHR